MTAHRQRHGPGNGQADARLRDGPRAQQQARCGQGGQRDRRRPWRLGQLDNPPAGVLALPAGKRCRTRTIARGTTRRL